MAITANDLKKIGSVYKDTAIRQLRKPLLEAFDVYKSNVTYGVEYETEEDRIEIVNWYKGLLDKEEWALLEIPKKIKRYL